MMIKTSSLFGFILLIATCVCGDKTADTEIQKKKHDAGIVAPLLRRMTPDVATAKLEEKEIKTDPNRHRDRDHQKKKLRQQRKLSDGYYGSDDSPAQDYTLAVRATMQLEMFGSDGSGNDRRLKGDEQNRRNLQSKIKEITNADINSWLDASEDFYFDSMFDFRATRGKVVNFQMGYLDSEWSYETQCFLVQFRAVITARGNSGLRVRQVARAMAQADYVTYITDYLWEEDDGNTPWFETQRVEYDGKPVIKGIDF